MLGFYCGLMLCIVTALVSVLSTIICRLCSFFFWRLNCLSVCLRILLINPMICSNLCKDRYVITVPIYYYHAISRLYLVFCYKYAFFPVFRFIHWHLIFFVEGSALPLFKGSKIVIEYVLIINANIQLCVLLLFQLVCYAIICHVWKTHSQ